MASAIKYGLCQDTWSSNVLSSHLFFFSVVISLAALLFLVVYLFMRPPQIADTLA